jgi:hypothetical protein
MAVSVPRITSAHVHRFRDEGYFVVEDAVPPTDLDTLRGECQRFVDERDREMTRLGVDTLDLCHRGRRYFVHAYDKSPAVTRFLFSDLMAHTARALGTPPTCSAKPTAPSTCCPIRAPVPATSSSIVATRRPTTWSATSATTQATRSSCPREASSPSRAPSSTAPAPTPPTTPVGSISRSIRPSRSSTKIAQAPGTSPSHSPSPDGDPAAQTSMVTQRVKHMATSLRSAGMSEPSGSGQLDAREERTPKGKDPALGHPEVAEPGMFAESADRPEFSPARRALAEATSQILRGLATKRWPLGTLPDRPTRPARSAAPATDP